MLHLRVPVLATVAAFHLLACAEDDEPVPSMTMSGLTLERVSTAADQPLIVFATFELANPSTDLAITNLNQVVVRGGGKRVVLDAASLHHASTPMGECPSSDPAEAWALGAGQRQLMKLSVTISQGGAPFLCWSCGATGEQFGFVDGFCNATARPEQAFLPGDFSGPITLELAGAQTRAGQPSVGGSWRASASATPTLVE